MGGDDVGTNRRATNQLLALQRGDGGWGQIPTRPSDAYATGQVLVALNQAGRVSPTTTAFQKGVAFSTTAQQPDGSWLVETRRTWKQGLPYLNPVFRTVNTSSFRTRDLRGRRWPSC